MKVDSRVGRQHRQQGHGECVPMLEHEAEVEYGHSEVLSVDTPLPTELPSMLQAQEPQRTDCVGQTPEIGEATIYRAVECQQAARTAISISATLADFRLVIATAVGAMAEILVGFESSVVVAAEAIPPQGTEVAPRHRVMPLHC